MRRSGPGLTAGNRPWLCPPIGETGIVDVETGFTKANSLIAAERRRRVYELALQNGAVNVSAVAEDLGVAPATIRRDLNALDREGKLVRSHGGAIVHESALIRPAYTLTRYSNLPEKGWIGQAAVGYLPTAGTVFLTGGTTTYELATRVPENRPIHVVTTSLGVATYLTSHTAATVHLLGGCVRRDTLTTNCLADPALEMLYWDVTFLSVAGLDIERGLTTVDQDGALCMRKIIERGNKLVLLCDSSKLGCYSHAKVGPVTLADVLITDRGASREFLEEMTAQGVEVVAVGPQGSDTKSNGNPVEVGDGLRQSAQ